MTDALVQFLRARLDEDERGAHAAMWADEESGNWHAYDRGPRKNPLGIRWVVIDAASEGVVDVQPQAAEDQGVAQYIARHDPARVLAEVDAKRAIVDWVEECRAFFWQTDSTLTPSAYRVLAPLAAVYADHPDYREEWRL
jgi:hypothetical protein